MADGGAVRLNIEKWLHIDIRWGLCFQCVRCTGVAGAGVYVFDVFDVFDVCMCCYLRFHFVPISVCFACAFSVLC